MSALRCCSPGCATEARLGYDTCAAHFQVRCAHARVAEADPSGRTPHDPGAKLDEGKVLAGVLADFSLALGAVARIGSFGARKYSRGGWQQVPQGELRYTDAMWRHLLASRHEKLDPEGQLHEAQVIWNALAVLELRLRREGGLV